MEAKSSRIVTNNINSGYVASEWFYYVAHVQVMAMIFGLYHFRCINVVRKNAHGAARGGQTEPVYGFCSDFVHTQLFLS